MGNPAFAHMHTTAKTYAAVCNSLFSAVLVAGLCSRLRQQRLAAAHEWLQNPLADRQRRPQPAAAALLE